MLNDHITRERPRAHSADALEATTTVTLVIPPAASLAPPRADRVGGVARIHPHWSALSTGPAIASGPAPNWGPGVVTSFDAPLAVTFHRRSGSFSALSAKTRETMSGLGPHEQAMAEELDTDPLYTDFRLQGGRIVWNTGTYTFDFLAHHVEDGLVAGEVKADPSYFHAPGYSVLMANAERTLNAVGISFRKVDGNSLYGNVVHRRNVRRAYCDRFTTVTDDQRTTVEEALAACGEIPLGHLHNLLGNDARVAQQLVHALLACRVLAYDLDLPVNAGTIVRAAPKADNSPDIRHLELSEAA